MIIEVSHADVDVIELIRVLCRNRLSVVMLLRNNGCSGEIYFREGRIIHASCCDGQQGEAAALDMLTWRDGDMRVARLLELPETTIHRDLESLLMDSTVAPAGRSARRRESNETSR